MKFKLYEVLIPVEGKMKVYLRAEDKEMAASTAYMIAKEMAQNGSQTIIPNLDSWQAKQYCLSINDIDVIEKGESDE